MNVADTYKKPLRLTTAPVLSLNNWRTATACVCRREKQTTEDKQDAVRWALISAPLLVQLVLHSGISKAGFCNFPTVGNF